MVEASIVFKIFTAHGYPSRAKHARHNPARPPAGSRRPAGITCHITLPDPPGIRQPNWNQFTFTKPPPVFVLNVTYSV